MRRQTWRKCPEPAMQLGRRQPCHGCRVVAQFVSLEELPPGIRARFTEIFVDEVKLTVHAAQGATTVRVFAQTERLPLPFLSNSLGPLVLERGAPEGFVSLSFFPDQAPHVNPEAAGSHSQKTAAPCAALNCFNFNLCLHLGSSEIKIGPFLRSSTSSSSSPSKRTPFQAHNLKSKARAACNIFPRSVTECLVRCSWFPPGAMSAKAC